MTALRAHHRGGPEQLVVEQVPVPAPAAGEVLVAVHAAGITFDELTWDETWTRDGVSRMPVVPSHEVSGVVYEVATDVTDFVPGDQVYGLIRFDRDGAAAEFVSVPAEDLAPARRACYRNRPQHAAELVRQFGAARVIDVRTQGFDESGVAYDVVVDTVGGGTLDRSFGVLRRGGRLITLSAPPPPGREDEYGVRATFFVVTPNRGQLAQLAALVDDSSSKDRLRVEIATTFPLVRGREAFESGRRPGRRAGKTVIVVRDRRRCARPRAAKPRTNARVRRAAPGFRPRRAGVAKAPPPRRRRR
jgi:NADPH:quinone reductase-like Zn-dependent oxidoreductase